MTGAALPPQGNVRDEDLYPMYVWHPSTSEWFPILWFQVWDGAAWV